MPSDEAVTRQSVILELFMRQAIPAGGQVTIADGATSAALLIAGMAKGQVKCSAAVSKDHPEVYSILEAEGKVESINDEIAGGEEDRTRLATTLAGGVGVVVAAAGVAETGSVVLADDSLSARLLSMLADICVVLLPEVIYLGRSRRGGCADRRAGPARSPLYLAGYGPQPHGRHRARANHRRAGTQGAAHNRVVRARNLGGIRQV